MEPRNYDHRVWDEVRVTIIVRQIGTQAVSILPRTQQLSVRNLATNVNMSDRNRGFPCIRNMRPVSLRIRLLHNTKRYNTIHGGINAARQFQILRSPITTHRRSRRLTTTNP